MRLFYDEEGWFSDAWRSCCHAGFRVPAAGQEPVEALKKQLGDMQQEMSELMKRIEELEQKKAEAGRVTSVEQSVKAIQESPSILNPSIGHGHRHDLRVIVTTPTANSGCGRP